MGAVECCSTRDRDCDSARPLHSPRVISTDGATNKRQAGVARTRHGLGPSDENEEPLGLHGAMSSKRMTHRVLADKTNTQEMSSGMEKLPSRGSEQHDAGQCKRCCFFPRNRCTNGYDCEFCHYEHDKRSHRKRKAKRSGSQPGIDVDLDDVSEDAAKFSGLEIQMPLSPDSVPGDIAITSWANTPEGAAVFVQSCLYTVPADTQENTSAVPVYTPTLWGDEQKPVPVRPWAPHNGEYTSQDGEDYQIPRDWSRHLPASTHENRFLPESGSIILPETAPLTLHQWQGDAHWQEQGCSWPAVEAGWEFPPGSEQAWHWSVHTDESCLASWGECPMTEDAAMTTSMCWNPQHADSHMPEYMAALDGQVHSHMPDYMTALDEQADSHMPEYMPAIQCVPPGVAVGEEVEPAPLTPASYKSGLLLTPLPPGVEVAVDLEPPPLSPLSPPGLL